MAFLYAMFPSKYKWDDTRMVEGGGADSNHIRMISLSGVHIQLYTVELQWLEHLWDQENMFETGVVRASEC